MDDYLEEIIALRDEQLDYLTSMDDSAENDTAYWQANALALADDEIDDLLDAQWVNELRMASR